MEHEETLTAADIDDIKHVAASMYGGWYACLAGVILLTCLPISRR